MIYLYSFFVLLVMLWCPISAMPGDWEPIGGRKADPSPSSESLNRGTSQNALQIHMDSAPQNDLNVGRLNLCRSRIRMVSSQSRPIPGDLQELENCKNLCKKLIQKGKDLPGFDLGSIRQMASDIEKILNPGGTCSITTAPNSAEAGSENVSIRIIAHVPQSNAYTGVTARLSAGSGALSSRTGGRLELQEGRTSSDGQIIFSADAFLDGSTADPGKVTISLFVGGKVCASAAFEWKKPKTPVIKQFSCIKDKKGILLAWKVKGAESIKITGCPGGCPSNLNPEGGSKRIPLPVNIETVSFTLTAIKREKRASLTKTVQLKESRTPIVSISPRKNSFTAKMKIMIKGRVSPPPSDAYRAAHIYVEGKPVGTAMINNSGQFEWSVPLKNKTKKEHLRLVLPDKTLADCDDFRAIAYLSNAAGKHEISNTIKAVVKLEKGDISASTVVRHLPMVTRIDLLRGIKDDDCVCENYKHEFKSEDAYVLEDSGHPIEIPALRVSGGFTMDDNCTCLQSMRIYTTVGEVKTTATYTININSDCP